MLPRLPTEIWDLICRWEAIIVAREKIKQLFEAVERMPRTVSAKHFDDLVQFMPEEDYLKLDIGQSVYGRNYVVRLKDNDIMPVIYEKFTLCMDCFARGGNCENHQVTLCNLRTSN